MSRQVLVYRSSRVEEMYLFVDAAEGLTRVPTPLMERFGRAIEVMSLELTPERALARSSAPEVLDAIARQGFHLQMPPTVEDWSLGR